MSSTLTSIAFPALSEELNESDILAFEEAVARMMDVNALLSDFSSHVIVQPAATEDEEDLVPFDSIDLAQDCKPIPPTFSIFGIAGDERVTEGANADDRTSSLGNDMVSSQFSCYRAVHDNYIISPVIPATAEADKANKENIPLRRAIRRKPAPKLTEDIPPPSLRPTPRPGTLVPSPASRYVLRALGNLPEKPSPGEWLRSAAPTRPRNRVLFPAPRQLALNISEFTLRRALGAGGQGKVYLATREAKIVALKTIRRSGVRNEYDLSNVLQEQWLLKSLSSPFVLRLDGSFFDSSFFYLITPFYSGGDLSSALDEIGQFSEEASRFYIAEITLGLDYMHARGIVHRDLKLANVFVKEDGHIVIGDLGLALDLKSPDKDDTRCCGTTPYMAPEMFDGRVQDAKVDMWALGVCFYMLLTGNLPFCGQDHWDTVRKIREEPVTFPPAYDEHQPETRMLARDLLLKDPRKRLRLSDLFNHPFFEEVDWSAAQRLELETFVKPIRAVARLDLEDEVLPPQDTFIPGTQPLLLEQHLQEYYYAPDNSDVSPPITSSSPPSLCLSASPAPSPAFPPTPLLEGHDAFGSMSFLLSPKLTGVILDSVALLPDCPPKLVAEAEVQEKKHNVVQWVLRLGRKLVRIVAKWMK